MLTLTNLTKTFRHTRAVDDLSLTVAKGQTVGVIGRSGAGKSTLLRLINRLSDPSSGEILCAGENIARIEGRALRRWRSDCAMIFQQFNLVGRLDVIGNVLSGRLFDMPVWRALAQIYTREERALAIRALDRLDMADFALQRAETLSGGQQQRVAIARALVQRPMIVLADEPIASLDPHNADLVMSALADICRTDGITVVCNLHALETARRYCDRIVGLKEGRLVFDGTVAQLDDQAMRLIYGDSGPTVRKPPGIRSEQETARQPSYA